MSVACKYILLDNCTYYTVHGERFSFKNSLFEFLLLYLDIDISVIDYLSIYIAGLLIFSKMKDPYALIVTHCKLILHLPAKSNADADGIFRFELLTVRDQRYVEESRKT